jgi:hypothetical protein
MLSRGSGYFGSSALTTSTANQEIIQQNKPTGYMPALLSAYKLSFMNSQDCHVIINSSVNQIYLPANKGFNSDAIDKEIYTFVIVEAGISYCYIGGY